MVLIPTHCHSSEQHCAALLFRPSFFEFIEKTINKAGNLNILIAVQIC